MSTNHYDAITSTGNESNGPVPVHWPLPRQLQLMKCQKKAQKAPKNPHVEHLGKSSKRSFLESDPFIPGHCDQVPESRWFQIICNHLVAYPATPRRTSQATPVDTRGS